MTLGIGLFLLVAGAFYYDQPDWDLGVSFLMGVLTYLTAPWGLRVVKAIRWKMFPLVILFYWVSVDGGYIFYNTYVGRPVTPELRQANFFASSLLYFLCGLIWLPQMTFREFMSHRGAILSGKK